MERVVVTGLGVVTAIGTGVDEFWKNAVAGVNGVTRVTGFDTSEYPTHYGGEIKRFSPYVKNIDPDHVGKSVLYAVSAARMAYEDAGSPNEEEFAKNTEVFVGSSMGDITEMGKLVSDTAGCGIPIGDRLKRAAMCNMAAYVCREFGIHKHPMSISNACASGNFAIAGAYERIKQGKTRFAIAGAGDVFSRHLFMVFSKLNSIAAERCRPFDKHRDGMIPGEGAGVLLMETLDSAVARGAHIYAEVIGWGGSCDAYHMAAPEPDGKGIINAVTDALSSAGISAADVGYISAHGTGTISNDKIESMAINKIFGRDIPVSSVKSMIGHAMGAASAIEAVICCMVIKEGILPPTINFTEADEECAVDCVPNKARRVEVKIAANNAYGFGGNNSCVLFARPVK